MIRNDLQLKLENIVKNHKLIFLQNRNVKGSIISLDEKVSYNSKATNMLLRELKEIASEYTLKNNIVYSDEIHDSIKSHIKDFKVFCQSCN